MIYPGAGTGALGSLMDSSIVTESWHHAAAWQDVRVLFIGRDADPARGVASRIATEGGTGRGSTSWLQQIHSARVLTVSSPGCAGEGDALVTDRAGLALEVVTADCVPVLLAGRGRVAAVHAGWRGLAQEVVAAAVRRFASLPEIAFIGPAISGAVYEVGEEVAAQIAAVSGEEAVLEGRRGRPHVDLQRAASIQLERLGISDVRTLELCTLGRADILHSYRRDGAGAGRNRSLIWRAS